MGSERAERAGGVEEAGMHWSPENSVALVEGGGHGTLGVGPWGAGAMNNLGPMAEDHGSSHGAGGVEEAGMRWSP